MNNNHICSIPASIYDSSETLIMSKCIKLKQKQGYYLLHQTHSSVRPMSYLNKFWHLISCF